MQEASTCSGIAGSLFFFFFFRIDWSFCFGVLLYISDMLPFMVDIAFDGF